VTPAQFEALAALTSIRAPAPLTGAKMVLVEGIAPAVAADTVGVSRQQLSNVLSRLRETLALARAVCG
jgi:predicted DNA-binding protein (UPF0251 family)